MIYIYTFIYSNPQICLHVPVNYVIVECISLGDCVCVFIFLFFVDFLIANIHLSVSSDSH